MKYDEGILIFFFMITASHIEQIKQHLSSCTNVTLFFFLFASFENVKIHLLYRNIRTIECT